MEETLERGLDEEEENEAVQSLRSAVAIAIFFSYFPNSAKPWIPVCKKGAGGLGVGECRVSAYFKFLYSISFVWICKSAKLSWY